ncbi:MAG: hypothetical protein EKK54_09450 [Neisseriaceae bacterium]|nr:MAG: hypothetical protein EKK54_09450 [Neisseriaceae bacterium]
MPIIKSILNMYPNVLHHQHYTKINDNMYNRLDTLHCYTDQPIRNVANMEWIFASYKFANHHDSRVILTGAIGNATISWSGTTLLSKLKKIYSFVESKIAPSRALNKLFDYNNSFKSRIKEIQRILFDIAFIPDLQMFMLTGSNTALKSTNYAAQLWYGTKSLDPTIDKDLVEFCYSIPQSVFYKNHKTINRRLLVRKGLKDILPTEVTQNTNRGEQAADFYLSYNIHQKQWLDRLNNLKPSTQAIIWKHFNKDKMLGFFKEYPQIPDKPNSKITIRLMILSRCLSFAFYLDQ